MHWCFIFLVRFQLYHIWRGFHFVWKKITQFVYVVSKSCVLFLYCVELRGGAPLRVDGHRGFELRASFSLKSGTSLKLQAHR